MFHTLESLSFYEWCQAKLQVHVLELSEMREGNTSLGVPYRNTEWKILKSTQVMRSGRHLAAG